MIQYIFSEKDPCPGNSFRHETRKGPPLWEVLWDKLPGGMTLEELKKSPGWELCEKVLVEKEVVSFMSREKVRTWKFFEEGDEVLEEGLAPHKWFGIEVCW